MIGEDQCQGAYFQPLEQADFIRLEQAAYLKGFLRPFKGKGTLEVWASQCHALRDQLIALAQSLRGEPDLGVSRSAGWAAAAPDAGRAAHSEREKAATSGHGRAEQVRRGRANTALAADDPIAQLDEEEAAGTV